MGKYIIDNSKEFIEGIDKQIRTEEARLNSLHEQEKKQIEEIIQDAKRKETSTVKHVAEQYAKMLACARSSIVTDPSFLCADSGQVDELLSQAQSRYMMPCLLVGRTRVHPCEYYIPHYLPWQKTDESNDGNFWMSFDSQDRAQAVRLVDNMLLRMLMAFQPGSIKFSFIDPMKSNNASFFTKTFHQTPELFYGSKFSTEDQIISQINQLNLKMEEVQKLLPLQCQTATQYYVAEKSIKTAYEVMVIYDYDKLGSSADKLWPLIENGNKYGIYLIVVQPNVSEDTMIGRSMNVRNIQELAVSGKFVSLICKDPYYGSTTVQEEAYSLFHGLDFLPESHYHNVIEVGAAANPLMKGYIDALPSIMKQVRENSKTRLDLSVFDNGFEDASASLTVPIGITSDDKEFNFEIDSSQRPHTFILGETGSGKSGLFHAIITTTVLKYSPKTVELYLMDFKDGGVEFNVYANHQIPHARAVLTDNSDRQIVLEIFQSITKEIKRRGELFNQAGVQDITAYNARQTDESDKLTRIVIAIDECQVIFKNRQNDAIISILVAISNTGRSYGIHLILATQTTYEANIPDTIMNNIANNFVLKCKQNDARRFLSNSEHQTGQFKEGEGLFIHAEKITKFRAHYIEPERDDRLNTSYNKALALFGGDKSLLSDAFPSFVFSSRQTPSLSEVPAKLIKPAMAMLLGKEVAMSNNSYLAVPIHKRESGANLLIAGNKGLDEKEAETNAMRVVLSSILSLKNHYKTSLKPYQIYLINRLENEDADYIELLNIFHDDSHCTFLESTKEVERVLMRLSDAIDADQGEQPDQYLYVLGAQRFMELRKNATILGQSGGNDTPEEPSDAFSFMQKPKQLTYKSVLSKILEHGPGSGIHTVMMIDKISNLLTFIYDEYGKGLDFNYTVMLRMNNDDAHKIAKGLDDLDTDSLSTNEYKLRAYLYSDINAKLSLFVPFMLPSKEYINQNLD